MRRFVRGTPILAFLLFFSQAAFCAAPCSAASGTSQRVFPSVEVNCKFQIRYLGSYLADAKYHASSRMDDVHVAEEPKFDGLRPPEVPAQWNLHPRERGVHNFLPSAHVERRAHGHSLFAQWRDDLITLVYGHEKALLRPRFVTTDPLGRVLVGDPAAGAIHVLDGEGAFRISAGPQDRLHSIAGVAADRDGNIYVGDLDFGLIVVFDRNGQWLREMGRFSDDEGLFHEIAGIAIDRERSQLYVADRSRDTVLILDLEGKVVARAGGRRRELGIEFERPTAIMAKDGIVLVADMDGTRIQVLDPAGKLLRTVYTHLPRIPGRDVSLDLDSRQNIYITGLNENVLRIFEPGGNLLAALGTAGNARGEFAAPTSVWIDEKDRIYVSEAVNRRVQVFEVTPEQPALRNSSASAQASR